MNCWSDNVYTQKVGRISKADLERELVLNVYAGMRLSFTPIHVEDFGHQEYLLNMPCPSTVFDRNRFREGSTTKNWWLAVVATERVIVALGRMLHQQALARTASWQPDFGDYSSSLLQPATLIHDRWASYFTYDQTE